MNPTCRKLQAQSVISLHGLLGEQTPVVNFHKWLNGGNKVTLVRRRNPGSVNRLHELSEK